MTLPRPCILEVRDYVETTRKHSWKGLLQFPRSFCSHFPGNMRYGMGDFSRQEVAVLEGAPEAVQVRSTSLFGHVPLSRREPKF